MLSKSCRKHTDNIGSKKEIMANKLIRSSKCAKCTNCVAKKSIFLKQKSNKIIKKWLEQY